MRVFLFVFVMVLAVPAYADGVRLERLNIMFEGNESASAYMRHCYKAYKRDPKAASVFLHNVDLTAGYLAKEMMAEYPQMTTDQAIEALSRRQQEMAGPLDAFYKANGCRSSQAQAASKHFEMFNAKSEGDMLFFLQDIENQ